MVESAARRPPDDTEIETRTPDLWAILGLGLGLLSPLASIQLVLQIIPILGILVSAVALARIKRDPLLIGRKAALAGMGLSTMFATLPLAIQASSYFILRNQPREMADQFLEFLQEGQPEKALMLHFAPVNRRPFDDNLWTHLRTTDDVRRDLVEFVERPMVRTLLELGKRADIRYYKTSTVAGSSSRALVSYLYTVTYNDERGVKKTFLIMLIMERKPQTNPVLNPWRVGDVLGDIDPSTS